MAQLYTDVPHCDGSVLFLSGGIPNLYFNFVVGVNPHVLGAVVNPDSRSGIIGFDPFIECLYDVGFACACVANHND